MKSRSIILIILLSFSFAFPQLSYLNPVRAQQPEAEPGSRAALRRCIESGRSQRLCFSEGVKGGFDQIFSGLTADEPIPPGLRMTGDYSSPGGFRLIFQPNKVTMICHGVPAPRSYSVEMTATDPVIKIQNGSSTMDLSVRPDGKLAASGPIHVTGQVPAGTRTEQTSGMTTRNTTQQRQLDPGEERYYPDAKKNGQVYTVNEDTTELVYGSTGSRQVTNYVSKSADCNLGLMHADGPTPLPPEMESSTGLLTSIFSGTAVLAKGGSMQAAVKDMMSIAKPVAPGLRMGGRYAGTNGFGITFHPDSATLTCGDAEHALEYSVLRTGNQISLQIQDKTPIGLQLKSHGPLIGQGPVQVNGRTIVGTTEDPNNPYVFSPKSARCEVGSLFPGASASGSPLTASTGDPNAPPPGAGSVWLKVVSGMPAQPGAANPLAGKNVFVLKDSLESVLARAGWAQPGSGSAIAAYARACETASSPSCQQVAAQVRPFMIAMTKLDANGASTMGNAQTGTYYLYTEVLYHGQRLLWNVRVDMKPGANTVTLDQGDVTPIGR